MAQVQDNTLRPAGAESSATQGPFPLAYAQESLWFVEQIVPGTPTYNLPEAWHLRGQLDLQALQQSLDTIVSRHEVLRTIFQSRDGKPEQFVIDEARLELLFEDLSGRSELEVQGYLNDIAREPFDLSRAPLARAAVFRQSLEHHILMLNLHHIISDVWSQALFMRELAACYTSLVNSRPCALSPLPIQYADFALWQREFVESEAGRRHLDYWQGRLGNFEQPITVPSDRKPNGFRSYQGQTHFLRLPCNLVESLRELSRRENATLFMTLLAGFQTLLNRFTGEDDIVIGSPMACRERIEVEGLLGLFVNTHALRADMSGDPTFVELLGRVREVVLDAYSHQEFPSELLLQNGAAPRCVSGHPLFRVVFGWQGGRPEKWTLPGLEVSRIELETGTAKFDWTILISDHPEGLELRSEFSTELFEPETMARYLEHYQVLLQSIVASPQSRISGLPLLSASEQDQLLIEWNQTDSQYERDARVHELFEAQAMGTPDSVALVHQGQSLTYGELNQRANRLARRLSASGFRAKSVAAIYLPRSPEMIISILAILKSGGVYLPLDVEDPPERLGFMLKDAAVRICLTDSPGKARLKLSDNPATVVLVDTDRSVLDNENAQNQPIAGTSSDPAYVMYTSGSTGKPKATLVPHRAIVRLVRNTNYLKFSAEQVFLHAASPGFDAATFEIWGPLLNGAQLVILPAGVPSLAELGRTIRDNQVTTLWLTSGLFDQMVEYQLEDLRGLKYLLAGGDILSLASIAKAVRYLPGCQVFNGYGPTENTTFTCCFAIPRDWPENRPIPIGRPISNTRVYVLDQKLVPVPIGVPGELYVGGDGLALGYLNRPELTTQKFVPDPFSSRVGERLYRTGDLVRWLPDGNLQFLGRIDGQIKIRGHRVEPGELENILSQHPSVISAAVTTRDDKRLGKQLAAYVALAPGQVATPADLRQFLQQRLPSYLLPSYIVVLDSLPLTPNGKIDRRALPDNVSAQPSEVAPRVAAQSDTEIRIARLWSELLGLDEVGVDDDFFQLGGHSLIATQLISRLSKEFNLELAVRVVFEAPTVNKLARLIDSSEVENKGYGLTAISPTGPARAAQLLERLEEFTEQEIEELLRDPELKNVL